MAAKARKKVKYMTSCGEKTNTIYNMRKRVCILIALRVEQIFSQMEEGGGLS